jgi:hypothetical protein
MPLGQRRAGAIARKLIKVQMSGPVTDLQTGQELDKETERWEDDPSEFIDGHDFLYYVFTDGYKANSDPQFRLHPITWQYIDYAVAYYEEPETTNLDNALTRILNSSLSLVQSRAARRHVDPELVALEDMLQDAVPIAKEINATPEQVHEWIFKKGKLKILRK